MPKTNLHIFYCILILFSLSACVEKDAIITVGDLKNYVNNPENGLIKNCIDEEYKIEISYKPYPCMFFEDTDTIAKFKHEKDLHYFSVSISWNDKELIYKYANRMSEYIEKMLRESKELIYIISESQDTIYPLDIQFTRTFGMAKSTKLLTVFNSDGLMEQDIKFKVDHNFLTSDDLIFDFCKDDFNIISKLNFK